MNTKHVLYVALLFVAVFAIAVPVGDVAAQSFDYVVDGSDGEHEGKTCPSKENKSSMIVDPNL